MKRLFLYSLLLAGACWRPATAAELKILSPTDRTVVGGVVRFQIMPQHAATDKIFADPDVIIQNASGADLHKLVAVRDNRTGVCRVDFDTRQLGDGQYLVKVTYRTLFKGSTPVEVRDDLTLGVRNRSRRPARFTVALEKTDFPVGESGDLTVRVFDANGRLLPAARVSFKVDRGDLDTDAEITDSDGEAVANIGLEEPGAVTVTVQVEHLPPMQKVITFTAAK